MGVIRLLLAVAVVIHHSWGVPALVGGRTAVLAFFVISGFYMNLVITEKYSRLPSWRKRFLFNRALRLYPTYLLALFLFVVLAAWVGSPGIFWNPMPDLTTQQIWLYRFFNISLIGQDILVGLDKTFDQIPNHPISPAWTIGSELLFYGMICVLPLRQTPRIAILATFLVVGVVLREPLCPETSVLGCDRFPSYTVHYFAGGALTYYIYAAIKDKAWAPPVGWVAFVAILVLLFSPTFSPTAMIAFDNVRQTGNNLIYISLGAAIPFLFVAIEHSKIDAFLGELSYPVYVMQMVGIFFGEWFFSLFGIVTQQPSRMALLAILSLLTYLAERRWVEPWRRRISRGEATWPFMDRVPANRHLRTEAARQTNLV